MPEMGIKFSRPGSDSHIRACGGVPNGLRKRRLDRSRGRSDRCVRLSADHPGALRPRPRRRRGGARRPESIGAAGPLFLRSDLPTRVFGPYYQREAVFVPLSNDLLVVFGTAEQGALATSAEEVAAAAEAASARIEQVSSAKRLADELELLHAVHSLAQTTAVRIHEVMQHVAESAIAALSCDIGALYVSDLDAVEIAVHAPPSYEPEFFLPAMRALFEQVVTLPAC